MCCAGSMSTSCRYLLDQTRTMLGPQRGARDGELALLVVGDHRDEVGKSIAAGCLDSLAVMPRSSAMFCTLTKVHRAVDLVGQHALEHAQREDARVRGGRCPRRAGLRRCPRGRRRSARRACQHLGERKERHDLVGVLAGRQRDVDGVAGELALEHRRDLLPAIDHAARYLRLRRARAEVRRGDHAVVLEQRALGRRLLGVHVDGRRRTLPLSMARAQASSSMMPPRAR